MQENPLSKDYTLNLVRVPSPTILYGIFFNEGVLESLGSAFTQTCEVLERGTVP